MSLNNISMLSTPDSLRKWLDSSHSTLWVGALSFEERCSGSLAALKSGGLQVNKGIALTYSTQVYPSSQEKLQRAKNWEIFNSFDGCVFLNGIEQVEIAPYSFQELQECLEAVVLNKGFDFVIFDITCLSKIHALALAAEISQWENNLRWTIAYTIPENYGNLDVPLKGSGWKDIIMAPLAETAYLFNEAHSRGIVMPGHEADRLIVALAELEPAGGIILIADTPKRPDLRILSERNNRKVIRQLRSMRSRNWSSHIVYLHDLNNFRNYLAKEILTAKEYAAPVILFPFGPKSLLFFAALQLCSEYPEASWFVYPIPVAYDVNYSEGIESTAWLLQDGNPLLQSTQGSIFATEHSTLPLFAPGATSRT